MIHLRDYQLACVDAIWANLDKHCVASLPTGAGKTPAIAELIRRFLEYDGTHILLLSHKRELLRQNVAHLQQHLDITVDIGVYCAGLHEKNLRQVTVASVQSLAHCKELPPFEIIIVDEVHLVPHKAEGQYRKLFERLPDARIIGVTATPYRMNGGMLHEGNDRLFEALVYEAKTSELIKKGWLSNIVAKQSSAQADLSGVHLRAGEYIEGEMASAMDDPRVTEAAVKDVLTHAADRNSILVFCAGVEHAKHIEQKFREAGQTSIATVTAETPLYIRDETTAKFKSKELRLLLNVGCFTTGFDVPNVDTIVLLRATKSSGLYVQIVGRGLRKCDGKKNCLLLDYGNNIVTHGPLDYITAQRATSGQGAAPVKTCPQCASILFAGMATCPDCGFLFPKKEREIKHGTEASDVDPIKPTIIEEHNVESVTYQRHAGRNGKPDSMKVLYHTNLYNVVEEWVCVSHTGYAQQKAAQWFGRRGVVPMPRDVDDAIAAAEKCIWPKRISVRKNGKYFEIVACSGWNEPKPLPPEEYDRPSCEPWKPNADPLVNDPLNEIPF